MGHEETLVLTRRRALQAGGAGAAAAFLLVNPWASKAIAAAEGTTEVSDYLLRSAWLGVTNPQFAVGNGTLTLERVADLPAAANVTALRGSEDAFTLTFSGAKLEQGIHEIRHSELGSFYVYVGEVGAPGDERLEVVVNRLERGRRRAPTPPSATQRPTGAHGSKPAEPDDGDKPAIRAISLKRGKRGARCVAKLDADANVRELTAWLRRGDRVVAATTRKVKRSRIEFNLKTAKRLRKGGYEVVLMATNSNGEQSYRAKRVTLR